MGDRRYNGGSARRILYSSYCYFIKKGEQEDPAIYRPFCMLSHVRKFIEKAVTEELEKITKIDRIICN